MDSVCAAGVTGLAGGSVFAVAYTVLPLGPASDLTVTPGDTAGTLTLRWTPGANATRHWIAGIKQSDWDAEDYSNIIWTAASGNDTHAVSGLDSGAVYVFGVAAGRGAEWERLVVFGAGHAGLGWPDQQGQHRTGPVVPAAAGMAGPSHFADR